MAQLTPPGRGAVATLQIRGPHARAAVTRFFHPASGRPFHDLAIGRIAFGQWMSGPRREDVVVCRGLGETVEVHCHGGALAIEAIKADLRDCGITEIDWTEWTTRAATNLLQAESGQALARATTEVTAGILLSQYNGALQRQIDQVTAELDRNNTSSSIEMLDRLLQTARWGPHLVEPWRVVLMGPANVGKSSLTNALVGFQRSLVHDEPGTTRDAVTELTSVAGWPMELTDTAGLRTSVEPLETEGMQRTWQRAWRADQLVLVVDPAQASSDEYRRLCDQFPASIYVLNKIDLEPDFSAQHPEFRFDVATSALRGIGLAQLLDCIATRLLPTHVDAEAGALFSSRQVELAQAARDALAARNMAVARRTLGALVGANPAVETA